MIEIEIGPNLMGAIMAIAMAYMMGRILGGKG